MRKGDLNSTQLRDINVFNLILDCDGWVDQYDTEKKFDSGELVNPEGLRIAIQNNIRLQVRFHAPVNMISLRITDIYKNDNIQFHFLFDNRPERILEWLVAVKNELNFESYPEKLKEADGRCEMILLEVSDTEIYEVKPPTRI